MFWALTETYRKDMFVLHHGLIDRWLNVTTTVSLADEACITVIADRAVAEAMVGIGARATAGKGAGLPILHTLV